VRDWLVEAWDRVAGSDPGLSRLRLAASGALEVASVLSRSCAAKAGIPVAGIAAGMDAYSGILTALYGRERTGQGRPCTWPCWTRWGSG
jgi:crotonobetainyl-CoA:carnitine CoA-transferase CaiB-like acyl-CoA transferase